MFFIRLIILTFLVIPLACSFKINRKKDNPETETTSQAQDNKQTSHETDTEDSKNGSDPKGHEISPTPVVPTVRQVSYDVNGIEMGEYEILVRWTQGVGNISISLNGETIYSQPSREVSSHSVKVKADSKYAVRVYTVDSDVRPKGGDPQSPEINQERTLLAAWEIKTPKDIFINQEFLDQASNSAEIVGHRLFFEKEKELLIYSKSLSFKGDELFFDKTTLSSFSEGTRAGNDIMGRNGGILGLKARLAHGQLNVRMRGEHGGHGVKGIEHKDRARMGDPGQNGYCAIDITEKGRVLKSCDRNIGPGHRGFDGVIGFPGSNGGAGGNSGIFKIEITDEKTDFLLDAIAFPGEPGIPGPGGDGQLGGLGGTPGHDEGDGNCCWRPNPANEGDGAQGPRGPDGIVQSYGQLQPGCVSIGRPDIKCF